MNTAEEITEDNPSQIRQTDTAWLKCPSLSGAKSLRSQESYSGPNSTKVSTEGFLVIDSCEEVGLNKQNKMVVKCKICDLKLLKCCFWRHWNNHNKKFKCDLCSHRYNNRDDLDEHQKLHETNFYKCEEPSCHKKYIYRSDLIRHVQGAHNWLGDQFECRECSKAFRDKEALVAHGKSHSSRRLHKCQQCEKSYKAESSLKIHLMSHNGIRPHQCTVCEQKFTRKDKLALHKLRHREVEVEATSMDLSNADSAESVQPNNKCIHVTPNFNGPVILHRCLECGISCKSCGQIFKDKRCSKAHTHHNMCTLCGKKSAYMKAHKAHERFHDSSSKFQCLQCQFGFFERSHFDLHNKKRHNIPIPVRYENKSEIQKYKCDRCEKEFGKENLLILHVKLHNDRIFRCSICDAGFTTKTLLDFHISRHMDDRRHGCSVCEKQFIRKTDLYRHERTHENVKTVHCHICDMKLKSKRNLQLHLKRHDEKKSDYFCYCGKRFLRQSHLKAHQLSSEHVIDTAEDQVT